MVTAYRTGKAQAGLFNKQLVFFYELCKAGVVRFDLNNGEHMELFLRMCDMMQHDLSPDGELDILGYSRGLTYGVILEQIKNNIILGEGDDNVGVALAK